MKLDEDSYVLFLSYLKEGIEKEGLVYAELLDNKYFEFDNYHLHRFALIIRNRESHDRVYGWVQISAEKDGFILRFRNAVEWLLFSHSFDPYNEKSMDDAIVIVNNYINQLGQGYNTKKDVSLIED